MSEQCPARQKINMLDADGTTRTVSQCIEPTSLHFAKFIEPTACEDCPTRLQAVRSAARGAPPKPEKNKKPHVSQPAKRADDCMDMNQVIKVKCCGEVIRTNYCRGSQSEFFGLIVTSAECNKCPVRRVAS